MFKVVNPKQQFSTGGLRALFNKEGKTWNTLGRLHAHFRLLHEYGYLRSKYAGCCILRIWVDFDKGTTGCQFTPIEEDPFYMSCVKN